MYYRDTAEGEKSPQVVRHYNGVDLVKFILSFFVVSIHFHPLTSVDSVAEYFLVNYLARIAVPFYFIASGFLCFRKTEYGRFDISIPLKYSLKIVKLYLLWSLIYFIPAIMDLLRSSGDLKTALLYWGRNLFFSGSYRQLWYLNATAFSVILISFLVNRRWKTHNILALAFALYCLGLLGQSYFGLLKILSPGPEFWAILDFVSSIIVTTRNGLFEGFIFVSIGLLFAYKPFNFGKRAALIGFVLSMLLLLGEVYYTHQLGWVKEYDMYIMLVPTSFFLFYIAVNAPIKDKPLWKELRETGALIFYLHTLVGWILKYCIAFLRRFIMLPEINSLVFYLAVVVLSYMLALAIKHLSRVEKLRFLTALYK